MSHRQYVTSDLKIIVFSTGDHVNPKPRHFRLGRWEFQTGSDARQPEEDQHGDLAYDSQCGNERAAVFPSAAQSHLDSFDVKNFRASTIPQPPFVRMTPYKSGTNWN